MTEFIRRHQLVSFFALAYAVSWGLLFVLYWVMAVPAALVIFVQTLGPTVAARIVLTADGGRPAYRAFRVRGRQWRVGVRWYVVALLGVPAVCLAGVLALPGGIDALRNAAPVAMAGTFLVYMIIGFFSGPLFEEPGWRGFALPRLEATAGPFIGTLALGVLWAAWHLPQFLVPEWAAQNGGSDPGTIAAFIVLVIALAPLLTWVYNNTGSVLMAMVTHASINASLAILPVVPSTGPIVVGLVGLGGLAIALIVATRGDLGYRARPSSTADHATRVLEPGGAG